MSTPTSTPSAPAPSRQVLSSMRRFRVAAWTVGVGLLVLVLIGMPLKYIGGDGTVNAIVGPLHGFLYMGYLVLAADLAYRARWAVSKTVLVALAGTIPFVSFVVERKVTRPLRDGAEPAASAPRSGTAA